MTKAGKGTCKMQVLGYQLCSQAGQKWCKGDKFLQITVFTWVIHPKSPLSGRSLCACVQAYTHTHTHTHDVPLNTTMHPLASLQHEKHTDTLAAWKAYRHYCSTKSVQTLCKACRHKWSFLAFILGSKVWSLKWCHQSQFVKKSNTNLNTSMSIIGRCTWIMLNWTVLSYSEFGMVSS